MRNTPALLANKLNCPSSLGLVTCHDYQSSACGHGELSLSQTFAESAFMIQEGHIDPVLVQKKLRWLLKMKRGIGSKAFTFQLIMETIQLCDIQVHRGEN